MIKNLSQLKKKLIPGIQFEILEHKRPECVGQRREINIANTQGFYSIIPGKPEHSISLANGGKGYWLPWYKAPYWSFKGDTATLYGDKTHTEKNIILKIRVGGAENV